MDFRCQVSGGTNQIAEQKRDYFAGCVREGHWSQLAIHYSLFAGAARSSYVAAYGTNDSKGELSSLLVRSVSDLDKSQGCLENEDQKACD